MSAATIFRIVNGRLGLAEVDPAEVGYLPTWRAPAGAEVDTAVLADYETASGTWSCQVTEMRITATPSTRTETVEDTICEPGFETPIPLKSSWGLVIAMYQDVNVAAGLQAYAHAHDAEEVYAFVAFNAADPPVAIGRVRMAPLTDLGGVARTSLKTGVTWPFTFEPQIAYGTAATSIAVPDTVAVAAADDDEAAEADVPVDA